MTGAARPRVCICVPVYNSAPTLAETLDSILAQTYREISVLIVDNASTDGSAEIGDRYAARDGRVRVLRTPENIGAEGNFTRCLYLASEDFTAIYHSDDLYSPSMVAEQVAFLDAHPEAGAVLTMAVGIDGSGAEGRVYRLPAELRGSTSGLFDFAQIFRTMLRRGNFLFCPSAMARTPVYRDHIKKWDAGDFGTAADGDVWLRIAQRYKLGVIDKPLLKYRISPQSFSYRIVRSKTGPHDMLKCFEAYISGPAAGLMGPSERLDFEFLKLKDNVNRSFTLLVEGRRKEVPALLAGIFRPAMIFHAFKCAYQLKTLAAAHCFILMSFLPLGKSQRELLFRLRFRGTRGCAG